MFMIITVFCFNINYHFIDVSISEFYVVVNAIYNTLLLYCSATTIRMLDVIQYHYDHLKSTKYIQCQGSAAPDEL